MSEAPVKTVPISRLTDKALHARVREIVLGERKLTLLAIDHLLEVDKRRLYAVQAYPSLFAYCTGYLGYSNAAAARRMSAARAIRRFPRVRGMLERRELTLSTLSLISGELRGADAGKLIDAIKGRSRRDAEEILAQFKGPVVQRERIKPVVVLAKSNPSATSNSTEKELADDPSRPAVADRAPRTVDLVRRGPDSTQAMQNQPHTKPVIRKMFRFEFAGDTEFFRKYERATALLSGRADAPTTIEHVMNRVFDVFLEQRDPVQRQARREKRRKRAKVRCGDSTLGA